jgi:prepilin-type N-terminal cleavage/methylation domain-containing protein
MTLTRKQQGFTIVELLIVIIVIGILAGLVITTFSGMQRRSRNAERQTDIKSIQTQLEVYFGQTSEYPLLENINDAAWRRDNNMKGLEQEALSDPQNTSTPLVATAPADGKAYVYVVTNDDDQACTNEEDNKCTKYTLTAKQEDGPDLVKTGLN